VAPSVQRRKLWLTPTTQVPCSNAAKMRNPLKFAGVCQTRQRISAISGPKFAILWEHVEEILLFNKFFYRLSICALVVTIWPRKMCDGAQMANFCILHFQQAACTTFQTCILNLYQGHTMCRSMIDIQSATTEIRQGKKERRKKLERKKQDKNIMSASATQGGHNNE